MKAATLRNVGLCAWFSLALLNMPVIHAAANASESDSPANRVVRIEMKNIFYHYTDKVAVHIIRLQGHLTPVPPAPIVFFDDKNSFTLTIASAEITMTSDALAEVLNQHVFAASDAPVKNLTIETRGNQLVVKGKLHQRENVPFETTGTISADPDGRIRLHAASVKAAHVPVKGLLDLLDLNLSRLVNTNRVEGVSVEKDDLLLDPQKILPPPRLVGKVTSVEIRGNEIVQIFGEPPKPGFAAKQPGNYMAYRDNELRFGKLTMHDTDMILIDMDPRDPFDFYFDHYKEQLVAGYTKNTPQDGLRVYMPDYDKMRRRLTRK